MSDFTSHVEGTISSGLGGCGGTEVGEGEGLVQGDGGSGNGGDGSAFEFQGVHASRSEDDFISDLPAIGGGDLDGRGANGCRGGESGLDGADRLSVEGEVTSDGDDLVGDVEDFHEDEVVGVSVSDEVDGDLAGEGSFGITSDELTGDPDVLGSDGGLGTAIIEDQITVDEECVESVGVDVELEDP